MRRIFRLLLILLASLMISLFAISGLFEDWLWFSDLGYDQLFWTPLISKGIIQVGNGTILFLFISGTLLSIRHAILTFVNERLRKRLRLVHEMDRPFYRLSQQKMTIWLVVISALVSFGVSFVAGFTGWLEVLTFMNPTPFGQGDPIFFKDLGFYVFQLPFLYTIYNVFFGPLFLLAIITTLFYIFTGVIRFHSMFLWRKHTIEISPAARRHLALLAMVLFIFKGFGNYFSIFRLLYSQQGLIAGAGYADTFATLPAFKILIVLCALGLIGGLVSFFSNEIRFLTLPILFVLLSVPLLSTLWPLVVQSLVVVPNELAKEVPYIQNEISLTRFAYGLDKISVEEYKGNEPISADRLEQELPTLNNISLNDPRLMGQIYTQKQGIKQYYKFSDIDVDRYLVHGEYRQVLLAPRELSPYDLASTAQTFVNFRFKYTHGFGVVASFANAVTEGLPNFAVRDAPPITSHQEFQLTQPRIYFGELTNEWVVVNTAIKEFDYPEGNTNVESNYQGKSGIKLTPLNRLMLSLKHTTPRFYLANEVNSQSRILLHRNIMERVEKLIPFLKYDDNPYLIINKGRLKWIIDGYTVSKTFPYSRMDQAREINYIRNSVKVVVDAYDGTVNFYAVDTSDPILQTYRKIFPGVFKDLSEMSEELRAHLRYPETLFTIQSNMLKNFHMTDPAEFYNKEDAWDIAKESSGSEPKNVESDYSVMRIPGSNHHELALMIPFTPASSSSNSRNNMISWLAARMDGEHYGELKLYKIPKNLEVNGPLQIESRIDQDPEISKQLALWNQKGSRVIRGHLQILPIAENFIYVEPIYLQANTAGSIPEMRRVVVAYEDRIVMAETLDDALAQLFGAKILLTNSPHANTANQNVPSMSSTAGNSLSQENAMIKDTQSLLKQIEQLRELLNQLEDQLRSMTSSTAYPEAEQESLQEEEISQ
ncbi:MAG: UPF0182 family protein [Desulfitobacterium sp.]